MKSKRSKIPFRNGGSAAMHLCIEPEGQCFEVAPGQVCEVAFSSEEAGESLEIECDEHSITVTAMADKEVHLNGLKVR